MTIENRIGRLTPEQRAFLASRVVAQNGENAAAFDKRRKLVAWFTTTDNAATSTEQLQTFAQENLPSSLRPADFMKLDSLPRTSTGKTDRRRLPEVLSVPGGSDGISHTRASETERRLIEIWTEVLGTSACSTTDDFFRLGGDSLSMIRVIALSGESGWHVTPTMFHENATIKRLASAIDTAKEPNVDFRSIVSQSSPEDLKLSPMKTVAGKLPGRNDSNTIICLSEQTDRPPLFLVPPKAVEVSSFRAVVPHINAFSCFAPVMSQRDAADLLTVEDVAQRFVSYIRELQPAGPYRLAGTCEGAYIAWEIACQLKDMGEQIQFLGIIDTPNPVAMVFRPLTRRLRLRLQSLTGLSLLKVPFHVARRLAGWARRRVQHAVVREAHLTRAGTRMGWKFSPRPFLGKAVLFRACRDVSDTDFTTDPAHGWDQLPTEGLHVWSLPCNRLQLLLPPFASMLAAGIQATMTASERATELQFPAAPESTSKQSATESIELSGSASP